MEILVPACPGEAVEPGHGRGQGIWVEAGAGGQFGQRGGAVHRAHGRPAAGQGPARWQAREHVAVPVPLVEDQPGRDVRDGVGVPVVHRVHRVHVGRGLVHEALARAVDQQAAGQAALGQAEIRTRRQRDGRAPPGVVHEVERRPRRLGRGDRVAGVARRSGGPLGADRRALVALPHRRVALETAGRQHHAAARPDQRRAGRRGSPPPRRPGRPAGAGRSSGCPARPAPARWPGPPAGPRPVPGPC